MSEQADAAARACLSIIWAHIEAYEVGKCSDDELIDLCAAAIEEAMKISPKKMGQLAQAGHLVSLRGRIFLSLESLEEVTGQPVIPEPPKPAEPPPDEDADVSETELEGPGAASKESAPVGRGADRDRPADRDRG